MVDQAPDQKSAEVIDHEDGTAKGRELELKKMFGGNFPGLKGSGTEWRAWVEAQLREQNGPMRDMCLWWARNRHFRQGRQWISSRDGRTWREMDADKNSLRMIMDLTGPALDFRLSVINEQRPGFKTHPLGEGINGREIAEAQQRVAEHYYNKQNGLKLMRDAGSNAQTDGVCFLHVFVDKNAGPSKQDVKLIPPSDPRFPSLQSQGYKVDDDGNLELPLNAEGLVSGPGTTRDIPLGDISTSIILAHEVFFDPEAKTVNGPYRGAKWAIIRRVRNVNAARIETGDSSLNPEGTAVIMDPMCDVSNVAGRTNFNLGWQRGLPPYPFSRQRRRPGVFEFMIYIAPAPEAGIENGLWRRIIGQKMVEEGDVLPGRKIPLARMTDGSSDTSMYPLPVMHTWIPDQLTINSIVSKLMEHARIFGTGRMIAQKGTVVRETYTNIVGSLLEYTGQKPEFLSGVRVSGDVWQSLQFFIKKLEDKTGWNDFARGQLTGSGSFQDVSGRAVLGARELFERQFAPMIRATAEGMSEWSALIVDHARFLFETPRLIPITGRGDLAQWIESKDLGDDSVVYVDPETLTPLPRALRNQMLFDFFQQGLITPDELRKRSPFAEIRDLSMGDKEQWERGQFINTYIEDRWEDLVELEFDARFDPEQGGMAVLWQDVPTVQKAALNEIIMDDRKPVPLRDLAQERWAIYDQMQRAQTVDPNTGMPGAQVPPVVRGVPADLQPPAPEAGAEGVPGAAGISPQQLAAPAPTLSPGVLPAATQLSAQPLGSFGQVEAQALEQQES